MTQPDPSTAGSGVLRRMLRARTQLRVGQGGAPDLPPAPAPTPARAAGIAVGRAADRLYGLPVRALAVRPGALTLAELPELLPELPMVAVLQGPGDLLGAIALCPQAVAALVEWQALGRVTTRGLDRRRPTRSDAMLCAEFIDALMHELAAEMEGLDGFEAMAGYRFMTHLDDPRPLALMLEDRPLRSLVLELAMGAQERREGQVLLALPQPASSAAARPARPEIDAPRPAAPVPPPPRPSLVEPMREAPVAVSAVLCRKRISLAELRGFLDGRPLSLPRGCLSQAVLETAAGQVLARGKFGEAEGCHALRLRDPALGDAAPGADRLSDPVAVLATGSGIGSGMGPGAGPATALAVVDLSQPDPFRDETPDFGAPVAALRL